MMGEPTFLSSFSQAIYPLLSWYWSPKYLKKGMELFLPGLLNVSNCKNQEDFSTSNGGNIRVSWHIILYYVYPQPPDRFNSSLYHVYQVSLSPIVRQTRSKSSCPVAWKSIGRHQKENQWSARSPYSPSWTQALRPWCWSWRGRPCPPSSSWASGCAEAFVRKRWVGEKVADVGEKPK